VQSWSLRTPNGLPKPVRIHNPEPVKSTPILTLYISKLRFHIIPLNFQVNVFQQYFYHTSVCVSCFYIRYIFSVFWLTIFTIILSSVNYKVPFKYFPSLRNCSPQTHPDPSNSCSLRDAATLHNNTDMPLPCCRSILIYNLILQENYKRANGARGPCRLCIRLLPRQLWSQRMAVVFKIRWVLPLF